MTDDPRVVGALQSSLLLRAVATLMHAVWRAASASRVTGAAVAAVRGWVARPAPDRRRAIGVMLAAAAAANLSLLVTHEVPPGWLWIVPPAMAASIGVVLMLSSRAVARTE